MKIVSQEIEAYCAEHTTPLPSIFQRLKETTYAELHSPQMQVGLLEGRFLGFLIALSQAKTVLEIGTFSGFSALAMASALPDDGKLITCDIDPKATAIAKQFWMESPHGKKIELRLGPAIESIQQITDTLDLAFIDADKAGYKAYWEACLPKLKPGGLLVVDNVLWSGRVLDPKEKSDKEIHAFNEMAAADPRVECLMLPVRDGILLARKK